MRRPRARHLLAALFGLLHLPILLALLVGAAVTGTVSLAAKGLRRLRALRVPRAVARPQLASHGRTVRVGAP